MSAERDTSVDDDDRKHNTHALSYRATLSESAFEPVPSSRLQLEELRICRVGAKSFAALLEYFLPPGVLKERCQRDFLDLFARIEYALVRHSDGTPRT